MSSGTPIPAHWTCRRRCRCGKLFGGMPTAKLGRVERRSLCQGTQVYTPRLTRSMEHSMEFSMEHSGAVPIMCPQLGPWQSLRAKPHDHTHAYTHVDAHAYMHTYTHVQRHACSSRVDIVMACIVMACMVMPYIVIACIVIACIAMACIVTA